MATDPEGLDEIREARAAYTRAIVESPAEKKLVVAGPGTGKTFTFREALAACGGKGLAMTFIRNLVMDLEEALGELADVFTFHGFCHHQVRKHAVDGLEKGWHYYPPLPELLAEDLQLLGRANIDHWELSRRFHRLDDSGAVITETLSLGSYYNTAGHDDVVYRGLRYFEQHQEEVPAYPLIVVDEYQDFSLLETSVIALLATRSPVLIAGDDDQGLYEFKGASPDYIRELASGGEYERFELPYCSRCTTVIVDAVNDVVAAARAEGNLGARLEKNFRCFLPDKRGDSAAYPKIIHAQCTIDRKGHCYPGRYIAGKISEIPEADIRDSHKEADPTALIIGPNPFLGNAFEEIRDRFPQARLGKGPTVGFDPLQGYVYIWRDPDSRLGWRILIHADPFRDAADVLTDVLQRGDELGAAVPVDWREHHLSVAALIGRLLNEEELSDEEIGTLEASLARPFDQLLSDLSGEPQREPTPKAAEPTIVCTTLQGAKGLSAYHVFVVGLMDGHFPRDPTAITDKEVCFLLVGLSRARRSCHVISIDTVFGQWPDPSHFLSWMKPHLSPIKVDKRYLANQGY